MFSNVNLAENPADQVTDATWTSKYNSLAEICSFKEKILECPELQPPGSLDNKIGELTAALSYVTKVLQETNELHHHPYLVGAEKILEDFLVQLQFRQMMLNKGLSESK